MHHTIPPRRSLAAVFAEPHTRWAAAAHYVDGVRDGLGKPVDIGIKRLVIGLNAHGFSTTGSCEGHLDWGIAAPWVDLEPEVTQECRAHHRALHAIETEMENLEPDGTDDAVLDELANQRRSLT